MSRLCHMDLDCATRYKPKTTQLQLLPYEAGAGAAE